MVFNCYTVPYKVAGRNKGKGRGKDLSLNTRFFNMNTMLKKRKIFSRYQERPCR